MATIKSNKQSAKAVSAPAQSEVPTVTPSDADVQGSFGSLFSAGKVVAYDHRKSGKHIILGTRYDLSPGNRVAALCAAHPEWDREAVGRFLKSGASIESELAKVASARLIDRGMVVSSVMEGVRSGAIRFRDPTAKASAAKAKGPTKKQLAEALAETERKLATLSANLGSHVEPATRNTPMA